MKKSKIYYYAYFEVLRRLEKEKERLKENPSNSITKHRIEVLDNEAIELHQLILEAEYDEAYK
jgi:hypothetical protein